MKFGRRVAENRYPRRVAGRKDCGRRRKFAWKLVRVVDGRAVWLEEVLEDRAPRDPSDPGGPIETVHLAIERTSRKGAKA